MYNYSTTAFAHVNYTYVLFAVRCSAAPAAVRGVQHVGRVRVRVRVRGFRLSLASPYSHHVCHAHATLFDGSPTLSYTIRPASASQYVSAIITMSYPKMRIDEQVLDVVRQNVFPCR